MMNVLDAKKISKERPGPTMSFTLIDHDDSPEEKQILTELKSYNVAQVGDANAKPLIIVQKDQSGKIIAGCAGRTSWGWLYIRLFWVNDKLRGQGIGKKLLKAAENEAVKRGCKNTYLDTFSFQALGFYQKQGYEIFGQLHDFPPGQQRYFLQKRL